MLPNTLPLDTTPPPPANRRRLPAAAAAPRRPRSRTNSVREAGRPRTAAPAAVRRPLHRHSPLPAPLQAAHRRQEGQGVHPQTQILHGSYSAANATQGPGPPARRRPLPGFPAAGGRQGPRRPTGYTSLHSNQQNRAGNRFPLARPQGFLHAPLPFSTTPLLGPPATAERRPD